MEEEEANFLPPFLFKLGVSNHPFYISNLYLKGVYGILVKLST